MKLKATSPLLEGWQGEAIITADHPASSYGRPVLIIEGQAVGTLEAVMAGYELVDATDQERADLTRGGYTFGRPRR